jgi:hypothetical protein
MSNETQNLKPWVQELKLFAPGFFMGVIRSIISHPFEMMKLKAQMGIQENFHKNLFKGLHLSIITNSLERGIQFYYFNKFKEQYGPLASSLYSSLVSTSLSLPYNIVLLKRNILNTAVGVERNAFIKSAVLEYKRNLAGSTIFLYSYDTLKTKFQVHFQAAGVLSGIIVWCLTYPIDNIKNQILAKKDIKLDPRFLYKGIQYPIMRSFPSALCGFYVYEKMNEYLNPKK